MTRSDRRHRFPFRALALFALLAAATTAAAEPAALPGDFTLRSIESLAQPPATASRLTPGRVARPFNSISTVTPNDTFLIASHGFQDPIGNCLPGGWSGQDLTSRVFAHVSGRFTVNDTFLTMQTRALWFGADSSSALDEIMQWVKPYGYGNGWSQRLTSPTFSRSSNPGTVLRFDAALDLRRADVNATNTFTPFGLASGKVGNDALSVQALKTDGTWTTLNGRYAVSGGPASWNQTPPLYESRIGPVPGALPPTLTVPNGCAVDDSGYVYIADRGGNRIVKTTASGLFITQWGTPGIGPGQMSSPFDVAVDHAFNVYVVDQGMRVQKFDRLGNFILQWGSLGGGIGQFNFPVALAVDLANNVYVADQSNFRVQKFNSLGSPILQFGSNGSGIGQFSGLTGMAVDPTGTFLYVADTGNHRIQEFTLNGSFVRVWGSQGGGTGQFQFPSGVDCDRDGNVWVADRGNNRIQRFTSIGTFLLETGTLSGNTGHFFNTPRDVAIARSTSDVYVCESGNNRVQYFAIGGPIAGEQKLKYEVRLDEDGNQAVAYAEPTRLRIVMQSNAIESSQDGLLNGTPGVTLVDNVTLKNASSTDVLAPLDFEAGTTGTWALSAVNQAANPSFFFPTISRDFGSPNTAIALRANFDLFDPSCVWTFVSPGDTLANGTYARLVSPWYALVPADSAYAISATMRLNSLLATRFLRVYTRGKLAGDTAPRQYHAGNSIFFGTSAANEALSPLTNAVLLRFPQDVSNGLAMDSVQVVFEVMDQSERLLGTTPEARPVARLPLLDDVALFQTFVDSDYDGVANAFDACPTDCAAGQDADGDGCVDPTATFHHIESWAPGAIHYRISTPGMSAFDLLAVRAAFSEWRSISGASVPLVEDAATTQVTGNGMDGINLVTRQDPEVQFPPGVLAITPTTSFTQRAMFGDRIVLPGEIVDSDLFFNPASPFTTANEPNKYDLQSVATHEIGHMIGLVHSGTLDATMFFVIQPGTNARSLTDDDRSAAAAAYPAANLATDFGTIKGIIFDGQTNERLGGALVSAVRLGVGGAFMDTTASDYSAEDGTYALRRLPPGGYSVRITPLDGNVGGFPLTAEYISQRLVTMQTGTFIPEWWNTNETDRDDPNLVDPINLTAGQTVTGINITTTVDTIPPTVVSTLPANTGTNIGVDTPILINFSEPVTPASLEASFRLRRDGLPPTIGGTGQLQNGVSFLFTPTQALDFAARYEIEISPALQDLQGVALADTFRVVFDTQLQPPLSITDIQPRSAPIGALVTITGTAFDSLTQVGFSACAACAATLIDGSQITPTSMVVRVPATAITGPVIVSKVPLNEVSNQFGFTVLPPRPQVAPTPSGAPVALGAIQPRDAAVSPDGATAYAAGDGGVAAVNVSTRAVTVVAVGAYNALALTPDGGRLLVTDRGNPSVHVIGAIPGNNLGNPLAQIPTGDVPGGIAVSPNGRRAYVIATNLSQILEIDLDPASPTLYQIRRTLAPLATLTAGIAVSLDGTQLYLTSNVGLLQLDLNNGSQTVLNGAPNNFGIGVTPSGGEVIAPGAAFSGTMVLATIPLLGPPVPYTLGLGGIPRDVGVTPEGQSALIVDSQTNEMRVLDVDPGSATYHGVVSTVPTGASPLGVGLSSLSPVLAVANFGDRTLSLYTTANADNGLQRVISDVALPGDQVAVHSSNDSYVSGTTVDLAEGAFASDVAIGTALAFTVPVAGAHQHATTLTLETPTGTRSLSLPFTIVDPITTFTPRAATLPSLISFDLCTGPDPDQGLATLLCSAPNGQLMAMNRSLTFGDCNEVDFIRATPAAERIAGENLTSAALSHIGVTGLCFTPDSRFLYVIRAGDDGAILDADPASLTFGQNLGNLVRGSFGHFPSAAAADPLNRYMVVSTSEPGIGPLLVLYQPDGSSVQDTASAPGVYQTLAVSRDGRTVVCGAGGGVSFFDLTTHEFLPTPPQDPGLDNVLQVVVTTNGKRAVGLVGGTNIVVWNLDPAAGAIGASLYFGHPIAANLTLLTEGSDGHSVILGTGDSNTLYKLDVGTLPPAVTSADVGQPFTALTRSLDGRRLWGVNSVAAAGGLHTGDLKLWNLADAAKLTLITGGGQSGQTATTLPVPFRVRLTGADGRPQAGVLLKFSVSGGEIDGVVGVFAIEHMTDANGEAAVTWALLGSPGTATMTIEALGGTASPLVVPAEIVSSDADIIPSVILFGPIDGATNINAGTSVFARFNQAMNTDTLPNYAHLDVGGAPVPGAFSFQDGGRVVIFTPAAALPFGASATFTLEAGAKDLDAQASTAAQSATFTVQSPPALALQSISPPAANVGATVVIDGTGFSPTTSNDVVTFNGVLAPVKQASLTSLTVAVPVGSTSGPVVVHVGASQSGPLEFTVLSPNADPGTVVGDVDTGEGVSKIAFTPDGLRAYVTNPSQNSVTAIDVALADVITQVTVGLKPQGIAILPNGSRAYVANKGSSNVSVIDIDPASATYHTVVNTIHVGDEPVDVAVSGIGPKVFVANAKSGTVSIIDANPGNGTFDQVVTTVNTGSGSGSVAISPDGGRMYVGTASGVTMVDLASLVVTTVNTGSGSGSVAVSPDGTIVIALLFNGSLVVIDAIPGSPTFNQVVTTVNTGSGSGSVAISPDGGLAYVTSADGNTVQVFQIGHNNAGGASSTIPSPAVTLTLVATIPVGESPNGVALSPSGIGLALVANAGSGTVSFIGTPPTPPGITVGFQFSPSSLNLKSIGQWVEGTITPPAPFLPSQVVVSSVRINGSITVDPTAAVSINGNTIKLRFSRAALQLVLPEGDAVPVKVTGTIDGTPFSGVDHIRVKLNKVTSPHLAEVVDPAMPYTVRWSPPSGIDAQWVALLHSLDHGASWTLDATHLPNSGSASWTPPVTSSDSVKVAVVVVEATSPGDTLVTGVLGVSDYFRLQTATAVEPLPVRLEFRPVAPSPSRGSARLRYGLPSPAHVELELYDVTGRRTRTLVSGGQDAGWHDVFWDGAADDGSQARSGLYFARLRVAGQVFKQRVVWIH